MGYMKIRNLYAYQEILELKECYASEKIHGTSAHVCFNSLGDFKPFSVGVEIDALAACLPSDLKTRYRESGLMGAYTFYGEAYGGKMQKMRNTYGDELRFIVFDVRGPEGWLDVNKAFLNSVLVGFEFVPYRKIKATIEEIDREMARPSEVAFRRGIEGERLREGVVLRPIHERLDSHGHRLIVKHKNDAFKETRTRRKVQDPRKLKILEDAREVADEWVTDMRLTHVLDKLHVSGPEDTPQVIRAMVDDVLAESEGEIVNSKEVRKAIGKAAARMYHLRLKASLYK